MYSWIQSTFSRICSYTPASCRAYFTLSRGLVVGKRYRCDKTRRVFIARSATVREDRRRRRRRRRDRNRDRCRSSSSASSATATKLKPKPKTRVQFPLPETPSPFSRGTRTRARFTHARSKRGHAPTRVKRHTRAFDTNTRIEHTHERMHTHTRVRYVEYVRLCERGSNAK